MSDRGSGHQVSVVCTTAPGGYACDVTVGDDRGATHHAVTLTEDDLRRFGGPDADPVALVSASFAFLLAHEAREGILRQFALPVIGRYFHEYPREIRNLLAAAGGRHDPEGPAARPGPDRPGPA